MSAHSSGPSVAGAHPSRSVELTITVRDEQQQPVSGARITLTPSAGATLRAATDFTGSAKLRAQAGNSQLRVEKEGFYAASVDHLDLRKPVEMEVTLRHVQEFHERVEVSDSAPAVDPAQTASQGQLTNRELFSLPYPTTRDFRQALPFIPRVVLDQNEQIHVAGAAGYELYHALDGFDVTQPVSGLLDLRLSPDALRMVSVQDSRYSAEYGKGSGGVLQMDSGMGDDHFRFSATNFTPGLSFRSGLTFENVTPRLVFSGPIRKGKAWWFQGLDGEYDTNLNTSLPSGRNEQPLWRVDSLSKAQVNLTQSNILTGSFFLNHEKQERVGLSEFTPVESATDTHKDLWLADVKDSAYFNQMLLETGVAVSEFTSDSLPRGDSPFTQTPTTLLGSFFESSRQRARRVQGIANLYLPPVEWHGRHEFQVGTDLDAIKYHQFFQRNPIFFTTLTGTLIREASFLGPPRFSRDNFQASAYAQDRWSPTSRFLLEYGLRGDWDEVLRDAVVSPRIAATYFFGGDNLTKLSAGTGLVYDATNLDLITRPLQGLRQDQNFAADGVTPVGAPILTTFLADVGKLQPPRFLNSSLSLERMFPAQVYLRIDIMDKRERHGLTYANLSPTPLLAGEYLLTSAKNDRYDAVTVTARKKFALNHELFGSYTHSVARSNAVLDFSLDNPLFAQQAGGPLNWDSPNRFLSWGWLPLFKQFDFAYSLDWRTGFPFSVVNAREQLVGVPNSLRFPDYFSLDLHIEHRFRLESYEFAVRLGVNNVTGRKDPALVNNDIDSPQFLTFGAFQKRAFTARIRFLGRK